MKVLRLFLSHSKAVFLTAFGLLFTCLIIVYFSSAPSDLTDFNTFRSQYKFSNSFLFSDDGRLVSSIRKDYTRRNLIWTELADIDSDFIEKVLQKEDKRFYSHIGFDFLSVLGAIRDTILGGRELRGSSTITMQFAKLNWNLKTKEPLQKIKQILYSLHIERSWSKNEILEAYLNSIYFQSDIQGIGTASLMLFDKMPSNLTTSEIETLRKKINRPSDHFKSALYSHQLDGSRNIAEHFHRHLLKYESFTSKKSTINYDLQTKLQSSIKRQLERLKDKNVHDAAILVIRNSDKMPVAYVGNSGFTFSSTPYVDMVHTKRPAGSTLKPFLYGLALENKLINVNSWIEDSSLDIIFENGTYSPKNHDQNFYGWVQIPTALASSLNVPAVKMIQMTGVEYFWNTLKNLNITPPREPEYYGPSLALGTLEVSLWDLTHAYSQFIVESKPSVFSQETRNIINWILSQPQHRTLTFGLNSILNIDSQIAVKTGTSKDMKDNWCIGYSKEYTVGVWVGNSDNSPMYNVIGVTGAAPIVREVFEYLYLQKNPGLLVTKEEADLLQNIMDNTEKPEEFKLSRIISPAKNSIYAVDPAIPLKNQKIFLETDGKLKNLSWKYNGLPVSENRISLTKGRHRVELYHQGKKIDESTFLVK